ncbi:Asp23/Gls24 family envelope stress response protein [Kineococcus endophyticus]|uniref:Asp23/Gls24 family envelope stress response protein n=1 Tax=Kineococcus endophyticus TaxID=1181883 RepID=A0ABV3P3A9_9ACTN
MTDETVRPATAPEPGTAVPVVVDRPSAGGADPWRPGTTSSGENSRAPRTTMTDTVVAKIAGIAAAGVPGVHRLGGPVDRALDRALDGVRDGVLRGLQRDLGDALDDLAPDPVLDPGSDGRDAHRGVTVLVGEREAAVTVELTVEFGVFVDEVAAAVRREVSAAVQRMTDLRVREVDVRVADVHVPAAGPSDGPAGTPPAH